MSQALPPPESPGEGQPNLDARMLGMIRLAGIALLALGALAVLRVFLPAILLAGVVCLSTWPLYLRLRKGLGGHGGLAALVMVLAMVVLVIGPTAMLAVQLADQAGAAFEALRPYLQQGLVDPPAWLVNLPVVGNIAAEYWQVIGAGGDEAAALLGKFVDPAKRLLIALAGAIGASLLQMVFAVFVGYFIYRDGEHIERTLRAAMARLAGTMGDDLLESIRGTVTGVMQGLFGAALAQSLVALLGFLIAGVPGAFLLGSATFFVSLIPAGPPLLWGGAALWLFSHDAWGRGIFLVIWGVVVISSIDNLVRPYLISRGSRLSMALVVLGVVGGVTAFGFTGIFIGPPILALGLALVKRWTAAPHPPAA